MLMLQGTGWWEASSAADTDADLSNTRGHATRSRVHRSAPGWQAADWGVPGPRMSQSQGRAGPGWALHSLSWAWAAAAGRGGLGPACTWCQSHVATSVSNAFCCCARPADAVLARNYATSVIHTCMISWLCCSWEAADSKKVSQNSGEAKWYRWVYQNLVSNASSGYKTPVPFFSVYPKTNVMDLYL